MLKSTTTILENAKNRVHQSLNWCNCDCTSTSHRRIFFINSIKISGNRNSVERSICYRCTCQYSIKLANRQFFARKGRSCGLDILKVAKCQLKAINYCEFLQIGWQSNAIALFLSNAEKNWRSLNQKLPINPFQFTTITISTLQKINFPKWIIIEEIE